MERFKCLDDVFKPDARSAAWVMYNRESATHRPIALEDYYAEAASVTLNSTVPEAVQHHFLTARHLALYSWFVYRFTMAAQSQAYGSLEFALRERLDVANAKRRPTIRNLLEMAVSRGLLRDSAFRDWPGHRDPAGEAREPGSTEWVKGLPEFISHFRNELAHGSFQLFPYHNLVLRVVADAINQLYPELDPVRDPAKRGNSLDPQ